MCKPNTVGLPAALHAHAVSKAKLSCISDCIFLAYYCLVLQLQLSI